MNAVVIFTTLGLMIIPLCTESTYFQNIAVRAKTENAEIEVKLFPTGSLG